MNGENVPVHHMSLLFLRFGLWHMPCCKPATATRKLDHTGPLHVTGFDELFSSFSTQVLKILQSLLKNTFLETIHLFSKYIYLFLKSKLLVI